MTPELHALMVEAARRVLQEPALGRSVDPHRLEWARQVVQLADIAPKPCRGDDSLCPCQDGLVCHYENYGDTKAFGVR